MYAYVRTKRTTVTWMTRTKGGIFSAYVNRHRRLYEKSHTYTLANHPRMAQKKERNEFWRNDRIENERTNSRSLAGFAWILVTQAAYSDCVCTLCIDYDFPHPCTRFLFFAFTYALAVSFWCDGKRSTCYARRGLLLGKTFLYCSLAHFVLILSSRTSTTQLCGMGVLSHSHNRLFHSLACMCVMQHHTTRSSYSYTIRLLIK